MGLAAGLLAVSTVSACGGSKVDPVPDAAPTLDAATADGLLDAPRSDGPADGPIDAPTQSCAQPGDCPCFTNYECPAGYACSSAAGLASCVVGPRGTGVAGAPCTGESDCKSSLCVDDSSGSTRCSDVCQTATQCPTTLPRCVAIEGTQICVRNP